MTVWPATVNVPVRAVPVVLAATLNVTEPMPDPLAPAVTLIQEVVVVAVQEQAVPAMTLTVRRVSRNTWQRLRDKYQDSGEYGLQNCAPNPRK